MGNFLCGLFVSQLPLLAFVMEYIIIILQSPHSMSALRQALRNVLTDDKLHTMSATSLS